MIELCVFDKIIDGEIFGKFRYLDLTRRSSLSQNMTQPIEKKYFDIESSCGLTDPSYYRISTLPTTLHSNFNFLLNEKGIINPQDCRALVLSGHDISDMIPEGKIDVKKNFENSSKHNKKQKIYKIINKLFIFKKKYEIKICKIIVVM